MGRRLPGLPECNVTYPTATSSRSASAFFGRSGPAEFSQVFSTHDDMATHSRCSTGGSLGQERHNSIRDNDLGGLLAAVLLSPRHPIGGVDSRGLFKGSQACDAFESRGARTRWVGCDGWLHPPPRRRPQRRSSPSLAGKADDLAEAPFDEKIEARAGDPIRPTVNNEV